MKNLLLPAFLFFTAFVIAQNPNWHVFHGPLKISDIALDGDDVWMATPPLGVVRMDKNTGEWENYASLNAPFPNNLVFQIETDAQGRVWMAMWAYDEPSGLMVYDHGLWQTILQLPDGTPMEKPRISKDCAGRIWLNCNKGKVYSIENQIWTDHTDEFNKQVPLVYCAGTMGEEYWFAEGLSLMRKDDIGTVSYLLPDSLKVADGFLGFEWLKPVARFANGKILVHVHYYFTYQDDFTVYTNRLYIFNGSSWERPPAPFDLAWEYGERLIDWVDNSVYLEIQDTIYSFDGDQTTSVDLPGYFGQNLNIVEVDTDGNFWAVKAGYNLEGETRRLWKFNQTGGTSYPPFVTATLPLSDQGKVRTNKQGEIWYYGSGILTKISQQSWTSFEVNQIGAPPPTSQTKHIREIFLDWDGNPWLKLGPDIYTLNDFTPMRWDGSNWQACDHFFHSIAFAPDGSTYWYTDLYDQLHRRNGTLDEVFDHNNTPTLPVDGLKELTFDSNGALWAISAESPGKIYKLSSDWEEIDTPAVLPQFTRLSAGKQGNLWVNNYWNIWQFDDGSWTQMDSNWTVPDDSHYLCLTPDQGASAWIGSDGLLHWNGTTAEQIDIIGAKLPYNYAVDIAVDTFGNKWLATYYGLTVYNENGLQIDTYLTPTHEPPSTQITDFLSPNPFSETTQVDLKKLGFAPQRLSVFNAQGVLILTQSVENQETAQINRNGLPSGLYFVLVEGKNSSAAGKLLAR